MHTFRLDIQNFRLLSLGAMAVLLVGLAGALYVSEIDIMVLFVIALGLGITLFKSSFSFSAAYRNLFRHKDTTGVDSHIILLGATLLLFAPFLATGSAFGQAVGGAVAPVGVGMAFGAFIFGMGMQLGGACASGTLYTAGSGNPRMILLLLFFCVGTFWGSLDLGWWQELPALRSISIAREIGWVPAVALQLAFLVALFCALRLFKKANTREATVSRVRAFFKQPVILAAIILAILNMATLIVAGHPWSITWGFTLWAGKAAMLLGWDPMSSDFWAGGFQYNALMSPLWQDTTSVMNGGILLGALGASLLSVRKASFQSIAVRPLLAAIVGGLLLGYGARLAYGCNIGAFISGTASTSLHGWVWILCALPGNWIGMHLRKPFGLHG